MATCCHLQSIARILVGHYFFRWDFFDPPPLAFCLTPLFAVGLTLATRTTRTRPSYGWPLAVHVLICAYVGVMPFRTCHNKLNSRMVRQLIRTIVGLGLLLHVTGRLTWQKLGEPYRALRILELASGTLWPGLPLLPEKLQAHQITQGHRTHGHAFQQSPFLASSLCLRSLGCRRAAELLRSGINLLDAGTLCNQSSSSKKEKDGVFPQADVRPSSRTIFASPAYGAIIRLPTKPSQLPTMIAFLLISLPMA